MNVICLVLNYLACFSFWFFLPLFRIFKLFIIGFCFFCFFFTQFIFSNDIILKSKNLIITDIIFSVVCFSPSKYFSCTFSLLIKKILCKHLFVILQKQYNVINISLDELTNLIDVKSINANYNSYLSNEQICISINQINLVNFINKYLNGKYYFKFENGKYCIYNKDNLNLADSIFSNKTWTDIDLENFILHYRNINNFIFSLNSSVNVLKKNIKSLQFTSVFLWIEIVWLFTKQFLY